jgi:hypothetical protein
MNGFGIVKLIKIGFYSVVVKSNAFDNFVPQVQIPQEQEFS